MSDRTRRALPPVMPPAGALRAAQAMRRTLERSHRRSTLPLVRLLEQTVGMVEVQATAALAELGVPDAMAAGATTAEQIATRTDTDADALERLLAFLATRGIVRRRGAGWSLTATGQLLRTDHPDSIRDWVLFLGSDWQSRAWEHLAQGIRDPQATPFERAHKAPYFEVMRRDPERGQLFDDAMRSTSRLQGDLLARTLDLDGVGEVCDVGGGTGSVLVQLLDAHPHVRGRLVELPDVIERGRPVIDETGLTDRVVLEAGDMFDRVPADADRYLLSAVLHDWSDDEAVAILRKIHTAMTRPGARAIIVELELPAHDGASLERAYDLLMLVLGGGRERTLAEFEQLYRRAGLALEQNLVLANGWHAHHLARHGTVT